MTLDEIQAAVTARESSLNKHYWTLYSLAYGLQAQKVFEFGAGTSSRVLLEALRITGGHLVSCDLSDPRPAWARNGVALDEAISRQWTFLNVSSAEALTQVGPEGFDLVLHDGSHEELEVAADIWTILPRMKQFGLLLVHDVEQFELGPQVRRGVLRGVKQSNVQVSVTSLPYSDGLAILRVESPSPCGAVQTTWRKQTTQPAVPSALPWTKTGDCVLR